MKPIPLKWRFLRAHLSRTILLATLVFASCLVISTLIGIRGAALDAIERSTSVDFGIGEDMVLPRTSTGDEILRHIPGGVPVWVTKAELLSAGHLVSVELHTSTSATAFGSIEIQKCLGKANTFAVSRSALEALTVRDGGALQTGLENPGEARACAIADDPRSPSQWRAYAVVEGSPSPVAFWVNRSADDPQLRGARLDRDIDGVSRASVLAMNQETWLLEHPHLRTALYILLGLTVVATAMASFLVGSSAQVDIDSLTDSGMSKQHARNVISVSQAMVSVTAGALGISVTWLTMFLHPGPLAALVSQAWPSVTPDLKSLFLIPLCCLTTWAACHAGTLDYSNRWSRGPRRSTTHWMAFVLAALTIVALSASQYTGWGRDVVPVILAYPAVFVIVAQMQTWGCTAGTRSRVAALSPRKWLFAVGRRADAQYPAKLFGVCCAVACCLVPHVVNTFYLVGLNRSHLEQTQPIGSLAFSSIPEAGAQRVAQTFLEQGGRDFDMYALPVENRSIVRVTTPAVAACVQNSGTTTMDQLDDCLSTNPLVPIAITRETGVELRVSHNLVDGGRVGTVEYSVSDAYTTQGVRSVEMARATPGTLSEGAITPAAVTSANSTFARAHHLKPSGQNVLILQGFGSLDADAQAMIRGTAHSVAPDSVGSELTAVDPTDSRAMVLALIGMLATVFFFSLCVMDRTRAAMARPDWEALHTQAHWSSDQLWLGLGFLSRCWMTLGVSVVMGAWMVWTLTPPSTPEISTSSWWLALFFPQTIWLLTHSALVVLGNGAWRWRA